MTKLDKNDFRILRINSANTIVNQMLQRIGHCVIQTDEFVVIFGGYHFSYEKELNDVVLLHQDGTLKHHLPSNFPTSHLEMTDGKSWEDYLSKVIKNDVICPPARRYHSCGFNKLDHSFWIRDNEMSDHQISTDIWKLSLTFWQWQQVKLPVTSSLNLIKWTLINPSMLMEILEDKAAWLKEFGGYENKLAKIWRPNGCQILTQENDGNKELPKILLIGGGCMAPSSNVWKNPGVLSLQLIRISSVLNYIEPKALTWFTPKQSCPLQKEAESIPHFVDLSNEQYKNQWNHRQPFTVEYRSWHQQVQQDWSELITIHQKIGSKRVSVHVGQKANQLSLSFHQKNFNFQLMTISELLDKATTDRTDVDGSNQNVPLYLRSVGENNARKSVACVFQSFPEMFKNFFVPPMIGTYFSSALRIASLHCEIWSHYDMMDNVLIQLHGTKKVTLWPLGQATIQGLEIPYGGATSPLVMRELSDKAKSQSRYVILNPGQGLCIPAGWGHFVEALDSRTACENSSFSPPVCIGVNFFWKDERLITLEQDNSEMIYGKKDLYGNRDLIPGEKAMHATFSLLKALDRIAVERDSMPYICDRIQKQLNQIYAHYLDCLPADLRNMYEWKCWSKMKTDLHLK